MFRVMSEGAHHLDELLEERFEGTYQILMERARTVCSSHLSLDDFGQLKPLTLTFSSRHREVFHLPSDEGGEKEQLLVITNAQW